MFKNIQFLLVTLLVTQLSFAQKKEKIKGSKIVTVAVKEINSFENIEINDNFEVFLVKSENHTLAGFLLEISGNFPKKKQKITFSGIIFTIENVDKRRIKQIKVTLP